MKRPFIIWIAALILSLVLGYWALANQLTQSSGAARVIRGTAKLTVTGSVTVSPEAQSDIASPESGILVDSSLTEGQTVHAGDVLAQLDPAEPRSKLTEAQLNLKNIESKLASQLPDELQLAIAKKDLEDMKALHDKGYDKPAEYERMQKSVEQQEALAKQDRNDLQTTRDVLVNSIKNYNDQLDRLNIKAPYDGIITAVKAYKGDMLSSGETVATIISGNLKVEAEINQDDINAVREKVSAYVHFFAYRADQFPAAVLRVFPSSDKATQRFKVLIRMKESPKNLIAGLTGEASFFPGEHPNVLLIPRSALLGNNVVVVKDGHAEIRKIESGYTTLMLAEIKSGLAEGELVLMDAPQRFHDGESVRVTSITEVKLDKKP